MDFNEVIPKLLARLDEAEERLDALEQALHERARNAAPPEPEQARPKLKRT